MWKFFINKEYRENALETGLGDFGSGKRWYDRMRFSKITNIIIVISLFCLGIVSKLVENEIIHTVLEVIILLTIITFFVVYSRYIVDINMFVTKRIVKLNEDEMAILKSKMRDSDTNFKSIFDNSPYMHFIVSRRTGKIIETNRNAAEELGLISTVDVVGIEKLSLVHKNDFYGYSNDWAKVNSGIETMVDAEYRMITMDGKVIYVKERIIALDDNMIYTICRNITAQNDMMCKIIEQGDNLEAIYQNANVSILTIRDNGIVSCNNVTPKIFGIEKEKIVGGSLWELSPAYQSDGVISEVKMLEMIDIALKRGVHNFRWIFKKKNKGTFPAKIYFIKLKTKKSTEIYATIIDITESVRREEDLVTERNRVVSFINQSPNAIIIFDKDRKIEHVNAAFGVFFNIEIKMLKNDANMIKKFFNDLPSDTMRGATSLMKKEISSYNNEFNYIAKDNISKWYSFSGFNTLGVDNKYASTVLIFNDITNIMSMGLDLQLTKHKLTKLFDIGNDGVYEVDASYKIVSANDALKKIFADEDIVGKYIYDYVHDIEREKLIKRNLKRVAIKNTEAIRKKLLCVSNKGEELVVEVNSSVQIDESGVFTGVYGVVRQLPIDPHMYKLKLLERTKLKNDFDNIAEGLDIKDGMKDFVDPLEKTIREYTNDLSDGICENLDKINENIGDPGDTIYE